MSWQQRFESRVMAIAERLGRESGDREVDEETCGEVGLMGRYEIQNLGLADFESEFVSRLHATLDRLEVSDQFRGEVEQGAWRAWVAARNDRVRALCPKAREYGSED